MYKTCSTCSNQLSDDNWHTCFMCKKPNHGRIVCPSSSQISGDEEHLVCGPCTKAISQNDENQTKTTEQNKNESTTEEQTKKNIETEIMETLADENKNSLDEQTKDQKNDNESNNESKNNIDTVKNAESSNISIILPASNEDKNSSQSSQEDIPSWITEADKILNSNSIIEFMKKFGSDIKNNDSNQKADESNENNIGIVEKKKCDVINEAAEIATVAASNLKIENSDCYKINSLVIVKFKNKNLNIKLITN